MKINIVAIGKLSKEFSQIFQSYQKKILFYSKLNIIELKEVNHDNKEIKKKKETKNILKSLPKNSKIILCSLQGKQYDSEQFSGFVEEDNITFIIGGSDGVDESQFTNKICFSKMTIPHQLFRVLLVEQLFRSFTIKNNRKYHK